MRPAALPSAYASLAWLATVSFTTIRAQRSEHYDQSGYGLEHGIHWNHGLTRIERAVKGL